MRPGATIGGKTLTKAEKVLTVLSTCRFTIGDRVRVLPDTDSICPTCHRPLWEPEKVIACVESISVSVGDKGLEVRYWLTGDGRSWFSPVLESRLEEVPRG